MKWLPVCVAFSVVLAGTSVRAQEGGLQFVQAPSLLGCLTKVDDAPSTPEYPPDELKMKAGGSVKVRITFSAPDKRPAVKLVERQGAEEFEDAVLKVVRNYRLPCMEPDSEPVVAVQEFNFEPGDGRKVTYKGLQENDAGLVMSTTCVSMPKTGPKFPRLELEAGKGGKVLARVSFKETGASPVVYIVFDSHRPRLAQVVREHLAQYQFTCPLTDSNPLRAEQVFSFVLTDSNRYVLKDMGLKTFLSYLDRKDLVGAKFDTTQMGCPFDVNFRPRRPYTDNVVGEYGESDVRRWELLKWLRKLTMPMPKEIEGQLFDAPIKIAVPCATINF